MKRAILALLFLPTVAHAAYVERVTFSFAESAVSYNGGFSTAYVLLDDIEGMNPLCEAIPMAPSGGGTWFDRGRSPRGGLHLRLRGQRRRVR